MKTLLVVGVVGAALALATSAFGACAQPKASLAALEGEVMCPICHTTLDQSGSLAARQIEQFIAARIARCESEQQIKTALIANYGTVILAAPPRRGFDLLAWWLPLGGIILGAVLIAFGVWRWTRPRVLDDETPLDPGTDRQLDELLAGRLTMGPCRCVLAGFASVITPCVLPLAGYAGALETSTLGEALARKKKMRRVVSQASRSSSATAVFVCARRRLRRRSAARYRPVAGMKEDEKDVQPDYSPVIQLDFNPTPPVERVPACPLRCRPV